MQAWQQVEEIVRLMSTTEGRTKVYRLLQYTSKSLQLVMQRVFEIDAGDDGIRVLKALETLLGTCRKTMRLFRFVDMALLLTTVEDKNLAIRRVRQMRILTFFGMYLFENISLFYASMQIKLPRTSNKQRSSRTFTIQWRRWSHACWFLSLCLGLGLDLNLKRTSYVAVLKNLTEIPIALILTLRVRVDDSLLCSLGVASSLLALHLHRSAMPQLRPAKLFEGMQ
ncbi:unnamed protein product [Aphanomyces euteiches]|uniref:Uncharacterized protein n=1 Tax=Aphanomyces euteiches TaxID=100861 RepID=A0A6G0W4X7_9STRA|nr:hypothetical protein Ae201684_018622 [Aphanomyces euteiches]KAH9071828.1 hypothetical protein Ae201684P_020087 [Aphanomyces euteiches]KAH9138212.1 hypothetical protein AeRB84_017427 [Aphanomyces euteiches]